MKTNETFQYTAQYQKLSYCNTYHDVIEISHNIKSSKFSYCDDYDSDSTPPSTPLPLSSSSLSQLSSASSSASSENLAGSSTEYWLTCVYVVKNWQDIDCNNTDHDDEDSSSDNHEQYKYC